MALSGKLTQNFTNNSSFRLQLDWTATQDIGSNKSVVSAVLKLVSIASWGSVYDATSSPAEIWINGNKHSGSSSATISAWQTKTLMSAKRDVPHGSDGKKTFNIQGNYYFNITWGGSFVGWVRMSKNEVLNDIPRASDISNRPSFTLGKSLTVNISRKASNFTHTVVVQVGKANKTEWVEVSRRNNVATSVTFNFTEAENRTIANKLGGSATGAVRVTVTTSNSAGSKTRDDGVVTAPTASTASTGSYPIDTRLTLDITMNVREPVSNQTHDITAKIGAVTHTAQPVSGNLYRVTLTQAQANDVMRANPNTDTAIGVLSITTKVSGVTIRSALTANFDVTMKASPPKVTTTPIVPVDTNPKTVAVTGDNKKYIQELSKLSATVPVNVATGTNFATITKALISFGGETTIVNYTGATAVTSELGTIKKVNDNIFQVMVQDSRGNTAEVYSSVLTSIPYSKPTVDVTAERELNFNTETNFLVSGIFSPVTIGNQAKNSVESIQYMYVLANEPMSTTWETSKVVAVGNVYRSEEKTLSLDMARSWDIYVRVKDKLSDSYIQVATSVPEGMPMAYIDRYKRSISLGKFPMWDDSFETIGYMSALKGFKTKSEVFGGETDLIDDTGWLPGVLMNGATLYTDTMGRLNGRVFPVGSLIKITPQAVKSQDGQDIPAIAREKYFRVVETKAVEQSLSKIAYKTELGSQWYLEQDVVGGRNSLHTMDTSTQFPAIRKITLKGDVQLLMIRGELTNVTQGSSTPCVKFPNIWGESNAISWMKPGSIMTGRTIVAHRWQLNMGTGELSVWGSTGGVGYTATGWFPLSTVELIPGPVEGVGTVK